MNSNTEVELVVKSPYPAIPQQKHTFPLSSSIETIKTEISKNIAGNPNTNAIRIIYSGRVLSNNDILSKILEGRDLSSTQTFHFVFSSSFQQETPPQQQQQQQNIPFINQGNPNPQNGQQQQQQQRGGRFHIGFLLRLLLAGYVLGVFDSLKRAKYFAFIIVFVYLFKIGAFAFVWSIITDIHKLVFNNQLQQQANSSIQNQNQPIFTRIWKYHVGPFFYSLSPTWEPPHVQPPVVAAPENPQNPL